MADRVTGDQTDNVVGRTSGYYATPTTNCCGCPEHVFVVLRFSCPSISPLVVLSYCCCVLPATSPGGARHLRVVHSISFYFFLFFQLFLCPFRFYLLSTHLDRLHLYAVPVGPSTTARTSFHCLLCLLPGTLVCSISVSCFVTAEFVSL